jgi:hypothetical protein
MITGSPVSLQFSFTSIGISTNEILPYKTGVESSHHQAAVKISIKDGYIRGLGVYKGSNGLTVLLSGFYA